MITGYFPPMTDIIREEICFLNMADYKVNTVLIIIIIIIINFEAHFNFLENT